MLGALIRSSIWLFCIIRALLSVKPSLDLRPEPTKKRKEYLSNASIWLRRPQNCLTDKTSAQTLNGVAIRTARKVEFFLDVYAFDAVNNQPH